MPFWNDKQFSPPLLTDLYQLTMACAYWKSGAYKKETVFHLNYRKNPFNGGFAIACGLANIIQLIDSFHVSEDDIAYLRGINGADGRPIFPHEFLSYLKNLRFTADLEAVREGTVVFPNEPLLRITGPIIECQLLETAFLNFINFETLIATKSARLCLATGGDPVIEFGLRRAQGPDGGVTASRAAFVGGCAGTSNVLA